MLKEEKMTGKQVLGALFTTCVEVWHLKAAIKAAEQKAIRKAARPSKRSKRSTPVAIHVRRKEYHAGYRQSKASAPPSGILGPAVLPGACP